ncbi:MAG: ATP-dependent protease [Gammaproteobacteria bacterium]|nr:ATP-dependent protease [Gammaproteobacteria bacterium]
MQDRELIEVSLFPIPNAVAFPGTVYPLHVFEPRYRRLVLDSVALGRMVAVSHVTKTIHASKPNQTVAEALGSNQATFQPRDIFSAGLCEIRETTPDGRMLVEINMRSRLLRVGEIQTLPYRIVTCRALEDESDAADALQLQRWINHRLIAIAGSNSPDTARALGKPDWLAISPSEFSFKVFQFLRFDADIMQSVLEARTAATRLEIIADVLR